MNNIDIKYGNRKALAQMRCGSAPIAIETGRYRNGGYVPAEDRMCPVCNLGVENEFHVMLKCEFYSDIRDELLEHACFLVPDFSDLSDEEQFEYLMSNESIVKYTAKACRYIFMRRRLFLSD